MLGTLHIYTCVIGYAERKHIRTNMPVTERQFLPKRCRKYVFLMVVVHQNTGAWGEALHCIRSRQASDSGLHQWQNGLAVKWISAIITGLGRLYLDIKPLKFGFGVKFHWLWFIMLKKPKSYLIYSLTDSNWFLEQPVIQAIYFMSKNQVWKTANSALILL